MKHRTDLKGVIFSTVGVAIEHAVDFEVGKKGDSFASFYDAKEFLKELGYNTGSMQGDAPIGFSMEYEYISKWYNMKISEQQKLDGVIISEDFREGPVRILFFNPPNF